MGTAIRARFSRIPTSTSLTKSHLCRWQMRWYVKYWYFEILKCFHFHSSAQGNGHPLVPPAHTLALTFHVTKIQFANRRQQACCKYCQTKTEWFVFAEGPKECYCKRSNATRSRSENNTAGRDNFIGFVFRNVKRSQRDWRNRTINRAPEQSPMFYGMLICTLHFVRRQ